MLNLKRLVLGELQTNCYILYDGITNEACVIDPACRGDMIFDEITKNKLLLKYIIITHAHADHIGALDFLKQSTNAMVCIGAADFEALNSTKENLCFYFRQNAPQTKANMLIKENDELYLGTEKLVFIETPGHTKGGICVCFDGGLISGDTLFFESIGRWDFPGGDYNILNSSIKNKLFLLPDETKVYPGHGDSTTIGHEKKNNPLVI